MSKRKSEDPHDCIVCGKIFRGISDLRRHQLGPSIRHLSSNRGNDEFQFQCHECEWYFNTEDNLILHQSLSPNRFHGMHKLEISPRRYQYQLFIDDNDTPISSPQNPICLEINSEPITSDSIKSDQKKFSTDKNDRTVECLVCGKLFDRGMKDLLRHIAARTLQHHYNIKKIDDCIIPCNRCHYYFQSELHLEMHQLYTSCNPNYVKPVITLSSKSEISLLY